MTNPLLKASDLTVAYGSRRHRHQVLHGVSMHIAPGETYGLVGESGSGKTTLGRAILGLVSPSSGSITFDGKDITHASAGVRRSLAREMQVIFQDPFSSLNPSLTIRDILSEPLIAQGVRRADAHARVKDLLDQVAMPSNTLGRYSRDFSGGQRQRIAIARALALNPRLIVCDEPVSALDLSTQRRVLELLIEIQQRTGVAYLFISHDLAVVRYISHRVGVIYRGDLVEQGKSTDVTDRPTHEYTRRLWASNLVADPIRQSAQREARRALRAEGRRKSP
ncbi:ATP-binding cassette domain-containing protein [Microbacterium sp. AGC85]